MNRAVVPMRASRECGTILGEHRFAELNVQTKIDHHLDLRGKMCPFLTLELRSALNELAEGEVLEVVTNFYPDRQTIPQHALELGCSYELFDGDKPVFRFRIWRDEESRKE